MKKFLLFAILSLALAGCSKSPEKKLIGIINEATEKMKEAKTMEEADKVNKENKDAYDAIEKDKAKKEAVEAAGQGYAKVMMEKFFELNSAKQLAH